MNRNIKKIIVCCMIAACTFSMTSCSGCSKKEEITSVVPAL